MFNEKQIQKFLDFYHNRYKEWDETLLQTSTRLIEEWIYAVERDEIKARREELTKILWKKLANSDYKVRAYWPQSVLDKVFWDLYFNYWPRYIYNCINYDPAQFMYPWRWKKILIAFAKLSSMNDATLKIGCVKEKYWSFRCEYVEWCNEEMFRIINKLEMDTESTCAECWRHARLVTKRWRVTPLCYRHELLYRLDAMRTKIRLFFKSK